MAAVGAGGEGEAEGDGVDRLVEQRLGRCLLDDVAQRLQTHKAKKCDANKCAKVSGVSVFGLRIQVLVLKSMSSLCMFC